MGLNILFGSSSASTDKCFLLLLPCSEPCSQAESLLSPFQLGWQGLAPRGRRSILQAGSRGQGAAGWPHTPHIVLRGCKSALLMLGHAVNQPSASDRQRSPSIVGIHSHRQISCLCVSVIWVATATTRMLHQRYLGYWWTHFQRALEKETWLWVPCR